VTLKYPPHKHLPKKEQRALKEECFKRYQMVKAKADAILAGMS